jgi:palmitoyltransferase ZDHHC9/14/18
LGNSTTRSLGDGLRLLNERSRQQESQPRAKPQQLNLSNLKQDTPQKSPLSFRSGLSFGSKRKPAGYGHQHLSSHDTSQGAGNVPLPSALEQQYNQKHIPQSKNYEYFQGNTVFWLGGRLQNARDRPVNIATGIMLILPAILFFVFSCVPLSSSKAQANWSAGRHGYRIMYHQPYPLFLLIFSISACHHSYMHL